MEIFRSGKFSTKVEKFLHLPSGMQFGKRDGLVTEKNLPKWKIFHQKWKSCSTPRTSLARAVFRLIFFAEEKHVMY